MPGIILFWRRGLQIVWPTEEEKEMRCMYGSSLDVGLRRHTSSSAVGFTTDDALVVCSQSAPSPRRPRPPP